MLYSTPPLQTSPLSSLEKKQSLILKNAWRRIFPGPRAAGFNDQLIRQEDESIRQLYSNMS